MLQTILVQDLFLCTFPPNGIFEAITTPLTAASLLLKLGVMTRYLGVCCILADIKGYSLPDNTETMSGPLCFCQKCDLVED